MGIRNSHLRDGFYNHIVFLQATKPKKGRIGHGQGRIGQIVGTNQPQAGTNQRREPAGYPSRLNDFAT